MLTSCCPNSDVKKFSACKFPDVKMCEEAVGKTCIFRASNLIFAHTLFAACFRSNNVFFKAKRGWEKINYDDDMTRDDVKQKKKQSSSRY
jgi:hypothetical protein